MFNLLDFFVGVRGEFIQSLLLLPITLLMWTLSAQLYEKRRRKSYALLSKIMMGMALITCISVLAAFTMSVAGHEFHLLSSIIQSFSNSAYLLILFGYFRIHYRADLKIYLIFLGPAIICAVVGIILPLVGNILCLLSIGMVFYLFSSQLGRGRNNRVASCIFGGSLLLSTISELIPSVPGFVELLTRILPSAAYTLLFISLLEHSMLIMQSSYVSAITDPLTGLYNRRYFTKYISSCIERNTPVNVIFSDIDNFKKLNDTKGHKVGDEVLKQVADIFMEEVEGIGIAGRYGGEEMVVLIQNSEVDMKDITERMRARIENETIATASIGYRLFENDVAPDQLIKQADEAMYKAKQSGKNCVVQFLGSSSPNTVSENKCEKVAVSRG